MKYKCQLICGVKQKSIRMCITVYKYTYGVNQVIYIRMCSNGGNNSIMKLHANGHQQSIDQCTAAQAHVPLTGLCQSVNVALVL